METTGVWNKKMLGQAKVENLRAKSNEELRAMLDGLQRTQEQVVGGRVGYKTTGKLARMNPHPKELRRARARILTILNERRAAIG